MADSKRPVRTASDQIDYVPIWFWLLAIALLFIPLVNVVAVVTFAFVGDNRSRKNFFRAVLLVPVGIIGLHLLLFLFVLIMPEFGQGASALFTSTVQFCKDVWTSIVELTPARGTK